MTERMDIKRRIAAMKRNGDILGLGKAPEDARVVVAMSGGVDSSTTAALLHALGYHVIGITLQLYDHGAAIQKKGACCAGQDIHDARRIASTCGFPHYVLDYESRFKADVMEKFADAYVRGETPIPCVACNQTVKFRDLVKAAKELGADCLATGHYIRRVEGREGPELHAARDESRDQSYFLFATTRDQVEYLRFPLGDMPKREVRALARQFGLKVAGKPDSQDICFVPQGNYASVVERLRPGAAEPGEIVDLEGRVLGRHEGIIHYTIGQRKGLRLGGTERPLYVVRLEPSARRVVVGPREALLTAGVRVDGMNWLGEGIPDDGLAISVKIRSVMVPVRARVYDSGKGRAEIVFDRGIEGVSPGQAAVCYDRTRVLGGGFIRETVPAAAPMTEAAE